VRKQGGKRYQGGVVADEKLGDDGDKNGESQRGGDDDLWGVGRGERWHGPTVDPTREGQARGRGGRRGRGRGRGWGRERGREGKAPGPRPHRPGGRTPPWLPPQRDEGTSERALCAGRVPDKGSREEGRKQGRQEHP
jgi:hypothetical protein